MQESSAFGVERRSALSLSRSRPAKPLLTESGVTREAERGYAVLSCARGASAQAAGVSGGIRELVTVGRWRAREPMPQVAKRIDPVRAAALDDREPNRAAPPRWHTPF